jgi:hypothetical protein
MFSIGKSSVSLDDRLIDDRNERPLTIALATIVVVWSMAFAVTLASGHSGWRKTDSPPGAAAVVTPIGK